jgi:hypothetical protein
MSSVGHRFLTCSFSHFPSSSAETEPVRHDGCSGGYPWVESHLTGVRRVPAAVEARASSTSLCTPPRATPHRGGGSADGRSHVREHQGRACHGLRLSRPRDLLGDGPQAGDHFPRPGHDQLVGLLPASPPAAVAVAPPRLRLPPAILERRRACFETALEMAAHLGRRAVGPSACNQRPAGMGGVLSW